MDAGFLEKMSDQQIGQMYELMHAIQKRGREEADREFEEGVLGKTPRGNSE